MNYISGVIKLIFGFGALVVAGYGFNQYFGGAEKALSRLENLKLGGQTTIAEIDTQVLEVHFKRFTTYSLKYKFKANEKTYEDSFSFDNYSALDSLTGFVIYLPDDPKTSSLHINYELAKARKEANDANSSSAMIWVGILLTLFGLFNLFGAYRSFKAKALRSTNTPPPILQKPPPYPDKSDFV